MIVFTPKDLILANPYFIAPSTQSTTARCFLLCSRLKTQYLQPLTPWKHTPKNSYRDVKWTFCFLLFFKKQNIWFYIYTYIILYINQQSSLWQWSGHKQKKRRELFLTILFLTSSHLPGEGENPHSYLTRCGNADIWIKPPPSRHILH